MLEQRLAVQEDGRGNVNFTRPAIAAAAGLRRPSRIFGGLFGQFPSSRHDNRVFTVRHMGNWRESNPHRRVYGIALLMAELCGVGREDS